MSKAPRHVYHASSEELRAIDEALAAVERGEVATDEEVEFVFAKYRYFSRRHRACPGDPD
jgi:predicted transcriptional regulator